MHDPMVVAFEIRSPIPRRLKWREKHYKGHPWGWTRERRTNPENLGEPIYRWWRFAGWQLALAGRVFGMRHFITIWHVEPGGADSGEVCKHHRRWQDEDGKWQSKYLKGWKWHVYHWHIQVSPLQEFRRWLFQRCEWCGGPSRKSHLVNVSHQWDSARAKPWWTSAPGLYHSGCSSAERVASACLCDVPLPDGWNGAYGTCSTCGKFYNGEAGWIGYRRAVALSGMPEKGKPWTWPKEVDCHEIQKELDARNATLV